MTAYGRTNKTTPFGRLSIEIHSVNRKMLDMNIYLPKDLLRFDVDIRKWLSSEIERGQVTVRVLLQQDEMGGPAFQTQGAQLKMLKANWEKLASDLGCDPKSVDLRFLVDQLHAASPNMPLEMEGPFRDVLQATLKEALVELMGMKRQEGKALKEEIEKRLNIILDAIKQVEARKEAPLAKYRQKIKERLQETAGIAHDLEDKIAREVALLAEKMDVTEEVVRLYSHLEQFHSHLASGERSVGRTLDFLVQEMNREINTLSAKSADTEVSTLVVKMKGELEKIREQVQNIE